MFIRYRFQFCTTCTTYVHGTNVVKKVNFQKHHNLETHNKAVLRLKEKQLMSATAQSSSTECEVVQTNPSGAPKQTLLRPMLQKITAAQRQQLGTKFQLAHFTCSNAKSFKSYADLAAFEKKISQRRSWCRLLDGQSWCRNHEIYQH